MADSYLFLDACRVITATFQTIEGDQLIRLLGGISEAECRGYANLYKWEKRADGTYFIKNHEATIKSRNVEERVKFERKSSWSLYVLIYFFQNVPRFFERLPKPSPYLSYVIVEKLVNNC